VWRTPIFDRTEADVAAGAEKCYFSTTSLNRIEGNIEHLATLFGTRVNVKTNWKSTDFLTVSDMRRILANASAVKASYLVPKECPPIPSFPCTGWKEVNDLERNLHELYAVWRRNASQKAYTGEIFAGEEGIL